MQRKFLRNLVLLLVLNLLVKPFWILGIDRSVQNTVGTEEYGFYFAVLNFSFLFHILLDIGITTFNSKNIAQNQQLFSKHLSRILILKILLFFVYLVFTFTGAFIIDYSPEQLYILGFLAINQFLLSFILYLRSNLGGLHQFKTDSIISVLDRALLIVICGLLLWGNIVKEFKIQYFVYAQTLSYVIAAIVASVIVFRRASVRLPRLSVNIPFLLVIIKQSFPFALLVLLMSFHTRIDSIMLERILPDGARYSGIYASAYRLLDAANMIAYLFALLLLPIYARMLKQKENVENLVRLSFTIIIVPAIVIAVGSIFYSHDLMRLLYTMYEGETQAIYLQRIYDTSNVFKVLMICFCAISTMYIFSTLLTANGNLRILNIIAVGGIILNVTLNFILIPELKAFGSAIATLATQFITSAIQVIAACWIFRFKINYRFLINLLVYITGVFVIGYLSRHTGIEWYLSLGLFLALSLLWALALRIFRLRQVADIFRSGETG